MRQKILRLLGFIIFHKRAPLNLIDQIKLMKLLRYFTINKLAHLRVNLYHLTEYLSCSLSTDEKSKALFYHYNYLKTIFSLHQLKQLFNDGVECYTENIENYEYNIVLTGSSTLEFEGSLSLFLRMNGVKIAVLSFTIVPGVLFGLEDEKVGYITCLQRIGQHKANIQIAIKHFRDIIPSFILMRSFEAILSVLKIDTCVGVAYTNQITAMKNINNENYYSFYDERWMNYGGIYKDGNYIIPTPFAQKPLLSIKQTHRNRTVKKRNKLKEIYNESFDKMSNFVSV
jgi:uncharacterized protein VirK/YbjX